MLDQAKLACVLDPTAQASQGVVRDRAARQLLDPAAALADQVGVVPDELFPQLVPKAATGRVHSPQESCCLQQVNRPVHGNAIDALLGYSRVNLLNRERAFARADGFQDGTAWPGQAVTLSGERVVKRAPRSSR